MVAAFKVSRSLIGYILDYIESGDPFAHLHMRETWETCSATRLVRRLRLPPLAHEIIGYTSTREMAGARPVFSA